MNSPSISVIIPVYNGARMLPEAVASVLAQSVMPTEVILVNDGSTDNSAEVVESFDGIIRCLHQENQGIGGARNTAIATATGEYLAFLDADDFWVPDALKLRLEAFEENPSLDMVLGQYAEFYDDAFPSEGLPAPRVLEGYIADCLMVRRESFLRAGPFETHMKVGEFISWFLRAQDAGLTYRHLNSVICHRRIHGENTVLKHRQSFSDYAFVIKAALDRRRQK